MTAAAGVLFAAAALIAAIGFLVAVLRRARAPQAPSPPSPPNDGALLDSIVADMKEGLAVVGPDRRIRLANEAFKRIFGLPGDPSGRPFAEAVRHPRVLEALDGALREGREVEASTIEATGIGRVFELRATPLGTEEAGRPSGALLLFFDVTRLEALERVRRDFVADVSHELRTPLTAIKAFVETVIEERAADPESTLRFLEVVRRHTERMEELVDDVTDLSQIETDAVALELRELDVGEVAREAAGHLAHRHRHADVEVVVDFPGPCPLRADRRRLEQILVNLVDNGIKFNRKGGRVRVHGERAPGVVRVVVEDTGDGIPADAQEKVFHRFFRVDKARSREVGGTGLGLAIVKHLMRLHGGRVVLESELGRGSRFTLEFPSG